MNVNFIVSTPYISGGMRVVCEYANGLHNRGHHARIIYPLVPFRFGRGIDIQSRIAQLRGLYGNLKNGKQVEWMVINAELMRVPCIQDSTVPDADIIIATAWPTAYAVNTLRAAKGKKVYLVQSYETWCGPERAVDATYSLPLHKIVVSEALKDIMVQKLNQKNVDVIPNGVNVQQFHNKQKEFARNTRVLMLYHPAEYKGLTYGIQAFEQAKRNHPGIQLVMYSAHRKGRDVPEYVEFHKDVTGENLRRLYCSCDIFIMPSLVEGFSLPPMEAMACKCAVIATDVGGVKDYNIPGQTALVVEPGNTNALSNALNILLDNGDVLKRISQAGYEHIKQFRWDIAVQRFEDVLKTL